LHYPQGGVHSLALSALTHFPLAISFIHSLIGHHFPFHFKGRKNRSTEPIQHLVEVVRCDNDREEAGQQSEMTFA
jgi:hypothetical protein